jgi:tetratricopeptide (TPR) repeat protein
LAAKHYQKSIELDEGNIDAYLCFGQAQEQLSNLPRAKEAYEKVLRLDPENTKA